MLQRMDVRGSIISGAGLATLLLGLSLAGCGEKVAGSDWPVESTEQEWKGTPILTIDGEPLVSCGTPSFPVSAIPAGFIPCFGQASAGPR